MTKKDPKKAVKKWIEESINDDYLARMDMPFEEQKALGKLFPVEGLEVEFSRGMDVFRRAVIGQPKKDGYMRADLEHVHIKPISAEHYERYERIEHMGHLYSALILAQCGFKGLTHEDFHELQHPLEEPKFLDKKCAAYQIYSNIPKKELSDLHYEDFMALVDEVVQDKKSAQAASQVTSKPLETIAVAEAVVETTTKKRAGIKLTDPAKAKKDMESAQYGQAFHLWADLAIDAKQSKEMAKTGKFGTTKELAQKKQELVDRAGALLDEVSSRSR